jgi:hypothetical protein
MKTLTIAVDIDHTLIDSSDNVYTFEPKPIQSMIEFVNQLYDQGHTIILYTARGMGSMAGQAHLIPHAFYEKTKKQLDEVGVKYHHLVFGKIHYDYFIDDKAWNVKDLDLLKEKLLK